MKQYIYNSIKSNFINHYANFSGTLGRGLFWQFLFVLWLLNSLWFVVLGALSNVEHMYMYSIATACGLGVISISLSTLPILGAVARRLRDTNNSPWILLVLLIPFIGPCILGIILLLESKQAMVTSSDCTSESPADIHSVSNGESKYAYSGKATIGCAVLALVCSLGGYIGFEQSTNTVFEAYYRMQPGELRTLADKTLGDFQAIDMANINLARYYELLSQKDYQQAYRILAHREREHYGTYDQWVRAMELQGARQVSSIFVDKVYVDDDDIPTIEFDVRFKDDVYPSRVQVVMILERNEWRVEQIVAGGEE